MRCVIATGLSLWSSFTGGAAASVWKVVSAGLEIDSTGQSESDEFISLLQIKVETEQAANVTGGLISDTAVVNNQSWSLWNLFSTRKEETLPGGGRCLRKAKHDAVILYLVPAKAAYPQDWADALHSLQSLRGLDDANRAEVRLFVDKEDLISDADIQHLLDAAAPRDACVVPVNFRMFPAGMSEQSANSWTKRGWGYKHMIRFFFHDLFETNLLADFKYWMRMDTDSCLEGAVAMDPFGQLDKMTELAYLHNVEGRDCTSDRVVQGLHNFATEYAKSHNKPVPEALDDKSEACVGTYGNNIEIGRISAFQSKEVRDFQDAVRNSNGIYDHRWGDAALRRLTVNIAGLKSAPIPSQLLSLNRHPCHV